MYVRFMRSHEPLPRDDSLDALASAAAELARRVVAAATVHRNDRDTDGLGATASLLSTIDRLTAAVITVLQAADHHG